MNDLKPLLNGDVSSVGGPLNIVEAGLAQLTRELEKAVKKYKGRISERRFLNIVERITARHMRRMEQRK